MRALVVRPFGVKAGVDFDLVEGALIAPALRRLGIDAGDAVSVIEAGHIPEDTFPLLLIADLVIADITVESANAYYELGIRHALRKRRTFLLRGRGVGHDVPFDRHSDHVLAYDPAAPAEAVERLYEGLAATLASDRPDSPVFRLLPALREQDPSRLIPVPAGFREELEYAARTRWAGRVALLGDEARGSLWEAEGLRLVAREQLKANAWEAALVTLDALRLARPLDPEANLLLATGWQGRGDLPKSEEALRRVLNGPQDDVSRADRAEAWSLLGDSLKRRWHLAWAERRTAERGVAALASPLLAAACDAYGQGFRQDLHHFSPGLQAVALLATRLQLIARHPDTWTDAHASRGEAERRKAVLEHQLRSLIGAVDLSLDACRERVAASATPDPKIGLARADLLLLTTTRPELVVRAYGDVLAAQPPSIERAVRDRLAIYEALGVFGENVTRVLAALPPASPAAGALVVPRTILFTGHRIDEPGREQPRLPPEKEAAARAALHAVVQREARNSGAAIGIAGAASGGDILFHEVCDELGVPTRLFLALPEEPYVAASVAPAGDDWVRRFWAIRARQPIVPILAQRPELPGWLRHREPYSVWQRNNLWTLNEALAGGARHVTVLALWNGKAGDGPGGTADMIAIARARGADVQVIDTNGL